MSSELPIVEVWATAEGVDFADLEHELAELQDEGVELREPEGLSVEAPSDLLHTVLVSVTSTAGLGLLTKVLTEYFRSRAVSLRVVRDGGRFDVTYSGPARDQHEVIELVEALSHEQRPAGGEPEPLS